MNGNKFATGQILEKPIEVVKGRIFSWLSSKVSRTMVRRRKRPLLHGKHAEFQHRYHGGSHAIVVADQIPMQLETPLCALTHKIKVVKGCALQELTFHLVHILRLIKIVL